MITGGCNCGAVRFEVDQPLRLAGYCHCTVCRRRTGTAVSASAHPVEGSFRIGSGSEQLKVWVSPAGGEKWDPSVRQFVTYAAVWEPIPQDGPPRHPESRHAGTARGH